MTDDAVELSASQIKMVTPSGCWARWGAKYLGGLPEPESPATVNGKAVHSQLEAFSLEGKMPTMKQALAGLRFARAPGTAAIERALSFSTASSRWRGFIDVEYADLGGGKSSSSLQGADKIVIQDWKTTSAVRNVKTVEALLEDEQSNLYAYEAFVVLGARAVSGRWVYLPTPGGAYPVDFTFEKSKVVDLVEGRLDTAAREVQTLYKIRPKWTDLPKSTNHCFDFRRECPYKAECRPNSRITMPATKGDTMTDFKAHLNSIPGLPSVPAKTAPTVPSKLPAVPLKPAMPLVPKKAEAPLSPTAAAVKPGTSPDDLSDDAAAALVALHLQAQGKTGAQAPGTPESGHVNSPRFVPEKAAASPEEAVVMQGVAPAQEAAEVEDDLTALDKDQLRALALQMGALDPKKRPREDTLRNRIRGHRVAQAAVAPVPDVQEAATPEALTPAVEETLPTADSQPTFVGTPLETIVRPTINVTVQGNSASVSVEDIRQAMDSAYQATAATFNFQKRHLFVNSRPASPSPFTLTTADLLRLANEHLHSTHENRPRDYRMIPYTAAGDFVCAVTDVLERQNWEHIQLNTSTPEGSLLLNTLVDIVGANNVTYGI